MSSCDSTSMLESLGKKLGHNYTLERTFVWESSRGSLCGREFEHLDCVLETLVSRCQLYQPVVQVLTLDTHAMHEYFDFCHNLGENPGCWGEAIWQCPELIDGIPSKISKREVWIVKWLVHRPGTLAAQVQYPVTAGMLYLVLKPSYQHW